MAEFKPNFRIKKKSKDGLCLVYMEIYYDRQRLVYYPGIKIKEEFWIKNKGRCAVTHSELSKGKLPEGAATRHGYYNSRLNKVKDIAEGVYEHYRYNGKIPTPAQMRVEIDKKFKELEEESGPDIIFLTSYADDFIKRSNKKPNTIRNYNTTLNHIKEFEEAKGKHYSLDKVDLDFYDAFIKYFRDEGKSINTLGTHIKNLKVFLTDADDRGYKINQDVRKKRFKVVEERNPTMYLKEKEIKAIGKLDLSKDLKLDRVRDLFLIGCYTGLRYSDYNQIKIDHIVKDKKGVFLRANTSKTGEQVVVPLRIEVQQILSKYDQELPRVISNQKMNTYLKTIGRKAKLNEKLPVRITKGGMAVEEVKAKKELISTHTARRSFATNAFLAGVPVLSIMKITGHRTEKAFMRYIQMSAEDNAYKMADHPFFMGDLKLVKNKSKGA